MEIVELDLEPQKPQKATYTVSQISTKIKEVLAGNFPSYIWVQGEASGVKRHSSGHYYFSLKDDEMQIQAAMFSSYARNLNFALKDGMIVRVYCKVAIYPQRSQYQLIAIFIEDCNAVQNSVEIIRKKLSAEGLFDRKRPMARFIKKVGIITSKDGAVLHDMIKVLRSSREAPYVLIYPTRVQGLEAIGEICQAIEYFNEHCADFDVLLIGRGGGSAADLDVFNSEILARAIFASKVRTISCIGHETDFTIADDVSDLRAPTPSVASQIIVGINQEFKNDIWSALENAKDNIDYAYRESVANFINIASSRALTNPDYICDKKVENLYFNYRNLNEIMASKIKEKMLAVELNKSKLDALSPYSIMARGYSIIKDELGHIITNAKDILDGQIVDIDFYKGSIKAKTIEHNQDKKIS